MPPTNTIGATLRDDIADAIGQAFAGERRELRREYDIVKAEMRAEREAIRADMAALRAEAAILARDREAVIELRAAVATRLAEVRDGEPGPAGPPGEAGERGLPGEAIQGPPGETGAPGATGTPGEAGPAGPAGPDGPAGREWEPRGLFDPAIEYRFGEVVTLDGGAFVAAIDNPGPCPGPGWKQLVTRGKAGKPGERGPAGAAGPAGPAGPAIIDWKIEGYLAIPIMSDGSECAPLSLRGYFERYDGEAHT